MPVILALLRVLQGLNDLVLFVGRWLATGAIAIMVVCILVQVFFRYVLNNALPWPEEAARFLMLWMAGLIAPTAYRQAGFVSIDMLAQLLPRRVGALLTLVLLLVSGLVLVMGLELGGKHLKAGLLFRSPTLYVPLEIVGGAGFKLKLIWMYASLYVGLALLLAVNVELILRALAGLLGGQDRLRPIAGTTATVE